MSSDRSEGKTFFEKNIMMFGQPVVLACDGNCNKAWGINSREKIVLDESDPDDYAFYADNELGDAPADPGTYEGDSAKPPGPHEMNKWCARECERSSVFETHEPKSLEDFSKRVYNMPSKHVDA